MANKKKIPEIILDDGTEAKIVRGGITVRFNAQGGIDIYGPAPVRLHPAANDSAPAAKKELEPGDMMEDGTIFAGISPDTGEALYVTPQDAPGTLKWKAAMRYAAGLDANGHTDWRLPTKAELNVLYENRHKGALKGTFNERASGSDFAHWYWSCTEHASNSSSAWNQRFTDGGDGWDRKDNDELSVRCVRAAPRP